MCRCHGVNGISSLIQCTPFPGYPPCLMIGITWPRPFLRYNGAMQRVHSLLLRAARRRGFLMPVQVGGGGIGRGTLSR